MIVATAATKWRRKRKPGYLFGPPRRSSIDQAAIRVLETKRPEEKKKSEPKNEKSKPNRKPETAIKVCKQSNTGVSKLFQVCLLVWRPLI